MTRGQSVGSTCASVGRVVVVVIASASHTIESVATTVHFDRPTMLPTTVGPSTKLLLCSWLIFVAAAADDDRNAVGPELFRAGSLYGYEYRSAVFADGPSGVRDAGGPVGHRVLGRLSVARVWPPADVGPATADRLLSLHVSNRPFVVQKDARLLRFS